MVKRAVLVVFLVAISGSFMWGANYSVPAGTILNCRLSQTLSTELNYQGQGFTATLSEPLTVNGSKVIPIGALIHGRISYLSRPGRIKGVGEMILSPETLSLPNGRTFTLRGVLMHTYGAPSAMVADPEGLVKGPNSHRGDLEEIGLGMGGGGFLGTLIGGFHGALIGGVIGGAAGLVDRLRRRGPDLALPTGTELKFQLTRQLVINRSGIVEYSLNAGR